MILNVNLINIPKLINIMTTFSFDSPIFWVITGLGIWPILYILLQFVCFGLNPLI